MTRITPFVGAAAACAAAGLGLTLPPRGAAPPPAPRFHARISVQPARADVFAGARVHFRLTFIGEQPAAVYWSVVGTGTIDQEGRYRAPRRVGESDEIVASAGGLAAAASTHTVAPPSRKDEVAVVSCYDGGAVDVFDAGRIVRVGMTATSDGAAGVAADSRRRLAFIANLDRLSALDLNSGQTSDSNAVEGARFSEVALLADGYVAATDNNAVAGHPGVRVFRIDGAGVPVLVTSGNAGETPEGIAVSGDGRTFYVTNVNSNSVLRFSVNRSGSIRRTGAASTGHRPFGIAIDDARRLLFVADNDTPTISGSASRPGLEVFSLPSMRRVTVIVTGSPDALPLGVAVDSTANRLLVTNEGDGTVVAYSIAPLRRIAIAAAGKTPWLPSFDESRERFFVPSAMGNAFSVFDARTLRSIVSGTPTCGYPTSIAIVR